MRRSVRKSRSRKGPYLKALYILSWIALACLVVEAGLRIKQFLERPAYFQAKNQMNGELGERIFRQWWSRKKVQVFEAPFSLFANVNCDNEERLRRIFDFVKPPALYSTKMDDFLLYEDLARKHPTVVRTNRLGFRGPDRDPHKSPGTFRVMVLGAYQAFGWGVDYKDSYAAQLERLLNLKAAPGRTFEVWTFGLPASTAIVGLSILKKYGKTLKPDYVILDYGLVDSSLAHDSIADGDPEYRHARFPDEFLVKGKPWNSKFLRVMHSLRLDSSLLAMELADMAGLDQYHGDLFNVTTEQRLRWEDCLTAIKKEAPGIPMAILNQPAMIGDPIHETVGKNLGIPVYRIQDFFDEKPATAREKEEFLKNDTWAGRVRTFIGGDSFLKEDPIYGKYFVNFVNPLQLGPRGHLLVAQGLAKKILETAQLR